MRLSQTIKVAAKTTVIPKHIASDCVKFYKIAYRLRYFVWVALPIIFYTLWQIDEKFLRMWGLWIFITLIIQKGLPINQTILKFCETVSDTPTHLVVTQNSTKICVDYGNIQRVDYLFGWGWLNCYYVKITLNTPCQIGNHIYFVAWQDINNRQKSSETLAWIDRLQTIINKN